MGMCSGSANVMPVFCYVREVGKITECPNYLDRMTACLLI